MPKEKDFQIMFGKWLQHRWSWTGVFELKLARGKSLAFSAVQEHQERALLMVSFSGIYYKIPDDTYSQKPFDCFYIKNAEAYVVVMFYHRGQKEFIMIKIQDWMKEKENSDRKSLTEERAKEIGQVYLLGSNS